MNRNHYRHHGYHGRHGNDKTYLADCPVCIYGFTAEVDLRRHLLEHVLNCESKARHGASDLHIDLSTVTMPYGGATPADNPYRVLQSTIWPKRVPRKHVNKGPSRARRVRRKRPYRDAMPSGPRKRRATQRLQYESPPRSDGDGEWAPDTGYDDYNLPVHSETAAQQFRCSVCKNVFNDRESCQTHILTHIEKSTGPGLEAAPTVSDGARTKLYRCSVCAMLFNDRVICEKHIAVHATQHTAMNTATQDNQPIRVSLAKVSEPEKASGDKTTRLYRCGVCRAIFDDKLSCELHTQTHSMQATTSHPTGPPQNMPADDKPISVGTEELHRCSVCKKIFNDKISCEKHMESHTLRPPAEPQVKSGLLREILTRTSDQVKIATQIPVKLFRCSVCKEIFKDVASCERHTATHHLKPMKCVLCEKDCSSKADLMLHMDMIHPQVKFIQQEGEAGQLAGGVGILDAAHFGTGDMTPTELQDTQNHMMLAAGNTELPAYDEVTYVQIKSEYDDEIAPGAAVADVYTGDESGEEFADTEIAYADSAKKPTVVSHVQVVYARVEESRECSVCGKCLKTKRALADHIVSHPTCTECGERFKNKDMMFKHMRVSHKSECGVCGNVYNSHARLALHMKSHTGVEWPPKCQVCGKVFNKERELARHVVKHTKDYPHLCDQCGTGFVDKSKLVRHMQKHLQEKQHQCTVCEKRFNDKGVMKRHMLIHTGEKPYQCHRCGKAFREQTTLRNHLKRPACTTKRNLKGAEWRKAHSAEPSVCHICGEVCKSKRSLTTHVQKHLGVKPQVFPCEVCLDAFTTRGALTTHQRTCTPLEPGQV